MKKYRVTFMPSERIFDVDEGETILDAAMKAGVYIHASCGGNSSCGKCRIRVVEGKVDSSPHPKISGPDYDKGYRLACKSKPESRHIVVEVPLESQIDRDILKGAGRKPLILSAGNLVEPAGWRKVDPSFFKVYVALPEPTADDNISDFARLLRELAKKIHKGRFWADVRVLRKVSSILREASWNVTVTLTKRNEVHEITNMEAGDTSRQSFSVVVDIGTTTISAQVLELAQRSHRAITLGEASDYNSQISFGDDVISRIMYSRKKDGLTRLQQAVVTTVNNVIHEALRESGVPDSSILTLVFAGNTTMTHLFLGLDPKNIMLAPYTPVSNIFPPVGAKDLGLNLGDHVYVQAFPCVSSYVGGDIVSGVIGSGMSRSDKVGLFVDIGTNGEIVLGNKDWLICASCSAGPAFEGGGIQFGMRADKGAIEQVRVNPLNWEPMILTVGKERPKGICGSGLIDAIAELFATRILDQNGKFRRDADTLRVRKGESGYEYVLAYAENTQVRRDIVITEVDVDNLMRAKAALYAGCKVLLESVGLAFSDIESVIIAGGFGHYIDLEKAQTIGLLPELPLERFVFVGNGSLLGARLFSFSREYVKEAERVSRMMTNVELSNSQAFMDEFVAASFLPHTDGKAFPQTMRRLEDPFKKAMIDAIREAEIDGGRTK